MAREITLSRDEAELLTELLMLTDSWHASSLDIQLREAFGMATQEEELAGLSLDAVRMAWTKALVNGEPLECFLLKAHKAQEAT